MCLESATEFETACAQDSIRIPLRSYNLKRMSATLRVLSAVVALLSATALGVSQSVGDKQADLAAHMQKAKGYLDQKRPDLAIPELEAAASIDPENVEMQANLGVLLYFQGKAADAIPHLRAAIERRAGMVKIQGLLGLAEVRTQDFAQAQKDLESTFPLIAEQKFKVEVGLELVGLYTQSGDLDEASRIVAQLRKAAPDNPEVLYAAYRTYSDLSGESMLALSLAAPESAQMHQVIAHEETKQGNTNGAVENYRKAIAIDPHLPGVHFELAELLRTSQDTRGEKRGGTRVSRSVSRKPSGRKVDSKACGD